MSQKPTVKKELHPRNKHRDGYDFSQLIKAYPELKKFVSTNKYQNESIDFSNPDAVKVLNRALLKQFYGIDYWDIPQGYLCPPVPGRVDYIHYMADLLGEKDPRLQSSIKALDIGTGANLIYPILGHSEYGWQFVAVDIDKEAILSAEKIIANNSSLKGAVECRLQPFASDSFKNCIQPGEKFDLSFCNPPFHASLEEAQAGTERKWKNLGTKNKGKTSLNFGGQKAELWCEGGERSFVHQMIQQSTLFSQQCFWFSTLVSKSTNLPAVYGSLQKAKALEVKTIEMAQGNKTSRIVAWTFLDTAQQNQWREARQKK